MVCLLKKHKIVLNMMLIILVFMATVACDNASVTTQIETSLLTDDSSTSEQVLTTEETGREQDMDLGYDNDLVNQVIYPHNQVLEVNIDIDLLDYQDMIEHAMDEEYHLCDITYNGYLLENVAIRTKGNSSLRDVFEDGGDRFSFNVDLNYYEDQDLFGVDKLILNNLFMDPTMMAEFITYEALASLGGVTSRTTYVALSINGEYYGLYLSVEQIGNEFVELNFGDSDGELYKPDSGLGANLNYYGDAVNYSAFVDKFVDDDEDSDNANVIEFMERIESADGLEEVFNIESYLKYLAVSTYCVNLDSYQGGIYHNYYLYNNDGVFEWLAWDLNMSFNGFPGVRISDSFAIGYLIDEPVVNALADYPLIETILSNEIYLEMYHNYLNTLINGYFNIDAFETRVNEIDDMIGTYVETDPSRFYSYDAYQTALYNASTTNYSILRFVEERNVNILLQLAGEIPSSNNGEGNVVNVNKPGGGPPR